MKILLAINGSKCSEATAQKLGLESWAEGTEVQARDSIACTADILRKAGFKVDARVAENEIRTGILDVLGDWHADLIVLGSQGEKELRRFLLGSVAEV